jgi:internalin A
VPAAVRRAHLALSSTAPGTGTPAISSQAPTKSCYVSYAWGDETDAGRARDAAVEHLCAAAEAAGRVVVRDKTALRAGDRISDFMKRLGAGDRVFALISDKYLQSPHCMTELHEVWRTSHGCEATFRDRLRAFVLPCAQLRHLSGRVAYAAFWKDEFDKVESMVKARGSGILGIQGSIKHQMTARFAAETGDLLDLIGDVVVPAAFDDFLRYGFEDI